MLCIVSSLKIKFGINYAGLGTNALLNIYTLRSALKYRNWFLDF